MGLSAGKHEGGRGGLSHLLLSSPLFDPRRGQGVERSGRLSSRRHQAAAARNADQGRRPLAPGPEPRGPARTRRLAGSTGSMARTHPLTEVSTVAPPTGPPSPRTWSWSGVAWCFEHSSRSL